MPEVEGDKKSKKKFKLYPIGYFHIDFAEVRTASETEMLPASLWRDNKDA